MSYYVVSCHFMSHLSISCVIGLFLPGFSKVGRGEGWAKYFFLGLRRQLPVSAKGKKDWKNSLYQATLGDLAVALCSSIIFSIFIFHTAFSRFLLFSDRTCKPISTYVCILTYLYLSLCLFLPGPGAT
jgi:hypothetical protein